MSFILTSIPIMLGWDFTYDTKVTINGPVGIKTHCKQASYCAIIGMDGSINHAAVTPSPDWSLTSQGQPCPSFHFH